MEFSLKDLLDATWAAYGAGGLAAAAIGILGWRKLPDGAKLLLKNVPKIIKMAIKK